MNPRKIERLREAARAINLPKATKEAMIRNVEELWQMTYEEQIMHFQAAVAVDPVLQMLLLITSEMLSPDDEDSDAT